MNRSAPVQTVAWVCLLFFIYFVCRQLRAFSRKFLVDALKYARLYVILSGAVSSSAALLARIRNASPKYMGIVPVGTVSGSIGHRACLPVDTLKCTGPWGHLPREGVVVVFPPVWVVVGHFSGDAEGSRYMSRIPHFSSPQVFRVFTPGNHCGQFPAHCFPVLFMGHANP